ncbi:pleckstrin homology domain-containing family F member 2-like [Myxocyprinus asiaticus]|uniref:pleckstrin homology domain-containing family F member 2-like n=1 Tax=Myxocyprinus asiaticus TaxID=70543 RepID=UPI002223E3EA|nr:pleckstrin homology domain-containing family F member 2-like [Myxocyprinus asiaticus]
MDTELVYTGTTARIFHHNQAMEELMFSDQNRLRIQSVESTFHHTGKTLLIPGRILVGEGCLLKLCRRGPKPKVFFLFSDILVYGSIMLPGRWNNNQQIIPLEEVYQEDLEDGMAMANQWLIRTPRKSFYVAAASAEEKLAWMGRIEKYRALHLQSKGLLIDRTAVENFAATWIPDMASAICMRCSEHFNVTNRRHHCRRCGFIVCRTCSKYRALLPNISSRPVRVCRHCIINMQDGQEQGQKTEKGKYWKKNSLEDSPSQPKFDTSSEGELEEQDGYQVPTKWFKSQQENFSPYSYLKPEHIMPPVSGL